MSKTLAAANIQHPLQCLFSRKSIYKLLSVNTKKCTTTTTTTNHCVHARAGTDLTDTSREEARRRGGRTARLQGVWRASVHRRASTEQEGPEATSPALGCSTLSLGGGCVVVDTFESHQAADVTSVSFICLHILKKLKGACCRFR